MRVVLMPLRSVPPERVDRLQWPLFLALRRPVIVLEDMADVEGFGPAKRLREHLEHAALRPEDVVVVMGEAPLAGGAMAIEVEKGWDPRIVLFSLGNFLSDDAGALAGLLHTLGHVLGLGCCPNDACVMRHSNELVRRDGTRDAAFCRACRDQLMRQKTGL